MANQKHLEILKQGVEVWNKWRADNPEEIPDLENADLKNASLCEVNFKDANLIGADFTGANLLYANIQKAAMLKTKLVNSNLGAVQGLGVFLLSANLKNADLGEANLKSADLSFAVLEGTNLKEAHLQKARFMEANLQGADFELANLRGAYLYGANLKRSNLRYTNLEETNLSEVKYNRRTEFRGIRVSTCFGSQRFKRFALDQDFIEELKGYRKGWRFWCIYLPWLMMADCGRSLSLWALWSILFAIGFGVKYWTLGKDALSLTNLDFSLLSTIYYSVVTFTTLGFGDITPKSIEAAYWVMAEVVVGYIMLGGLISIFANKLARRAV